MSVKTPSINLQRFRGVAFAYDHDDDIAAFHIDGVRPAISEEVDNGWYLRLDGEAIVGLELHGVRRFLLSMPFYANLFQAALAEVEQETGCSLEKHSFRAEGPIERLPRITQLAMVLLGQASEKYGAAQSATYERLLAVK